MVLEAKKILVLKGLNNYLFFGGFVVAFLQFIYIYFGLILSEESIVFID